MKRTQLYLDEDIARILSSVSRQQGKTVSELVRECVREKFGQKKALDKIALAKQVAGLWKNRKDLGKTDRLIRRMRKGSRAERMKRG
jgi:Ribbon-helix-helix protein, copG family